MLYAYQQCKIYNRQITITITNQVCNIINIYIFIGSYELKYVKRWMCVYICINLGMVYCKWREKQSSVTGVPAFISSIWCPHHSHRDKSTKSPLLIYVLVQSSTYNSHDIQSDINQWFTSLHESKVLTTVINKYI